jgi:hypothetical protein
MGELRLMPLPVFLQGRVTQTNGVAAPIAGARITMVDNPSVPPSEHYLALRAPLALDHASGTTVRECQLTPTGVQRRVVFEVRGGSTILALDDVSGLAAGQVLRLGAGEDYGVIAALAPRPYEVTLRQPLRASLPAWSPVRQMTVTIPGGGASGVLTQDAVAENGVLILDQVLDVDAVEIDSGTAVEYRAVGAVTGTDGFYRLAGISGVQVIYLHAEATGFQPLPNPILWVVDYGRTVNKLDFTLEP